MNANCFLRRVLALTVLLALVASVTGAAWMVYPRSGSAPDGVAARDLAVVCFGYVDVEQGVARLGSKQSGRITAILVHEGDEVVAETPLLQIDDAPARSQLQQAETAFQIDQARRDQARLLVQVRETELRLQQSALDAAGNRLATARERVADAEDKLPPGRVRELKDARRDLEVAAEADKLHLVRLQIQAAERDLDQASAAVAARQEQVEQARQAVAECLLKAPFQGSVLRIRARVGELVGPLSPEALVEFCPDQPRLVRVEVPQEFAGRVRLGASCRLVDDYNPAEARSRGTVVRISDWYTHRRSILQEPMQFNDVRTLECLVRPDADHPPLRIGQRMRASIGAE
jgi:multidrug resistance efflux pump